MIVDRIPVHFRTCRRIPSGVTPIDYVAHADFARMMYRPFNGYKVTGTVTPDIDITDDARTPNTAVLTGDTISHIPYTRDAQIRLGTLVAEAQPDDFGIFNLTSPSFATGSRVVDSQSSGDVFDNAGVSQELIGLLGTDALGFMQADRKLALYFNASVTSFPFRYNGSVYPLFIPGAARMWIYAPFDGATPEEAYGVTAPPPDNDYNTYTAIPETDAGTFLGVGLKKKGWSVAVAAYTTGSAIYTPDIAVAEL